MAEEYKLPYSGADIYRRLRDVDAKASVAAMTTAEYDALENKSDSTLYMLTDAEEDDVDDSLTVELDDVVIGTPNTINADTLGGRSADEYVLKTEIGNLPSGGESYDDTELRGLVSVNASSIQDLQDLVGETPVSEQISNAIANIDIPQVDLSDYALKSDIPTDYLTEVPKEYITETELNAKGYLTEHQSLEGYATEEFVEDKLDEAKPLIVTEENASLQEIIEAKNSGRIVQSINSYGYICNLVFAEEDSAAVFVVTDGKTVYFTAVTLDGQWIEDSYSLPNPDNFYTKNDIDNAKYATEEYVSNAVNEVRIMNTNSATPSQVLEAMMNGERVNVVHETGSSSVTFSNLIYITSPRCIIGSYNMLMENISAQIMLMGSLSSDAWGYGIVTLASKDDIPTKVSDLENDSGFLSSIPNEYVTETEMQSYAQPKGNYLTSIPAEYVTESELNAKGYLTEHQSLNGLATETYVNTQVGNKVDKVDGKGLSTNDYTSADKTKLDNTNIAYGTCSTAADVAEKAVVLSGNTQWSLKNGSVIMVKFDVSNSAENVKINVNNTGAYPIWYNNAEYTSTGTAYTGYANRTITYMFNGTHYVWITSSYDANSTYTNAALGQGYATCSTAAATTAKVGTLSSYKLVTGGIVSVAFTNAVPANATLNINSTGAKSIYFRGAKITGDVIKAGDVATFVYSTYYRLISIDRWQNDIADIQEAIADKEEFLSEMKVVRYAEQTLTEAQRVQARLNIGAVSMEEITGASNALLGQTPLTLQEGVSSLRLIGEGDVSYTIKSDTVSDLENCISKTPTNAAFTKYEDCVEIKSTGGSGWYQSYIDVVLGGLTVGESYKFVVDASGHNWDEPNKVSNGKYIVYSDSGATLATVNVSDVAENVFSINFTATTEKVKVRAYPGDYMYTSGQSVARINSFYINRSTAGTRHTEIVDESGTFTDSTVLTAQPSGATITCTPTCSVYAVIQSDTDNAIKSRHGGKVCVCFGDSITGNMVSPNDYPSIIAAETGMKVINGGFGGCRMSDTHQTAAYAAFSMVKLADAIVSGDWTLQNNNVSGLSTATNGTEHLAALKEVDWNSVDFITIAYGTNDIQNYITIDDTANPKSTNTYLGSLRYSIEKILTAYPHIKLMVLTPMYRYFPDESTDSDSKTFNGSKYTEWGDGLIKVAEEYKIPYIDMYRTLGFNAITRTYYSSDGTHPNVKGCKVIGGKIAGRLLAEY